MRRQTGETTVAGPRVGWDPKTALRGWQRLLVPLGILLLVSIVVAGSFGEDGWRGLRDLMVIFAASVFVIPIHELGHAVFGRAVGLKIARVVVGTGKPLLQKRIRGVTWQWNTLPLGGLTMAVPFDGARFLRARYWMFALGGPAFHAGVAVLAWWLYFRLKGTAAPAWFFHQTALAATWGLAINLLPMRHDVGGATLPSDGRLLFTTPFMKRSQVEDLFVAYYAVSGREEGLADNHALALAWFERGIAKYPDKHALHLLKAHSLYRLGRLKEAKAEIAVVLAGTLEPTMRAVALNDWSWYAVVDRDEADIRLADSRSAEALALSPDMASLAGTRGSVLLWRGFVSQAMPLLERNLKASGFTDSSRASNSALVAVAHAAQGDFSRARAALDAARRLCATNYLNSPASATLAVLESGPRSIRAARGSRVVVICDDAVDLFDRSDRAGRRVPFAEITGMHIGLTARGRARMEIATDGTKWHMPLESSALWSARLMLHKFFALNPVSLPSTVAQAHSRLDARRLGQLSATAAVFALAFAKGGLNAVPLANTASFMLAFAALTTAGPAPLLSMGAAMLLGILAASSGQHESIPAPGNGASLWAAAQVAVAALAIVAGWRVLRAQADRRKQGLRMTVGVLLFMILKPAAIIGVARDPSLAGIGAIAASNAVVGICATSLALVLTFVGAPRWRWMGFLLGGFGMSWLFAGSNAFQDRFVAAGLGPRPAQLVWTVEKATIVHEEKLPAWANDPTVSPGGLAWATRFFATEADADAYESEGYGDDGDEGDEGDEAEAIFAASGTNATAGGATGSHPRAKPYWVVGDFKGHHGTIEGQQVRFIDDQRLLVTNETAGARELREISIASTEPSVRTLPLSDKRMPRLYAGVLGGDVHLLAPGFQRRFQDWVWSPSGGLTAGGEFPALGPREQLLGVIDAPSQPSRVLVERDPPRNAPVRHHSGLHLFAKLPRPEVILRGPDGDRRLTAEASIKCAGQRRQGELICVTQEIRPTFVVAIDAATGSVRRLASVPDGRPPASILQDGRIAISVGRDVAVIDPDAHRAWRLVLSDETPGVYSWFNLTSAGLAVVKTNHDGEKSGLSTLMVLAPPH